VSVVDLSTNAQPLYLHSGDMIKVHVFSSPGGGVAHQVITDVTTGQTGQLVMDSNSTTGAGSVANPKTGDGPLQLPYSVHTTKNAMPWGVVLGTPMAFSWEIGHSNFYTHAFQGECVPGQWDCQSYDTSNSGWGAVSPFQLMSVKFEVKGKQFGPDSWATNDSQGGGAEDDLWCGGYGPARRAPRCAASRTTRTTRRRRPSTSEPPMPEPRTTSVVERPSTHRRNVPRPAHERVRLRLLLRHTAQPESTDRLTGSDSRPRRPREVWSDGWGSHPQSAGRSRRNRGCDR
jgi:hypothetical protein